MLKRLLRITFVIVLSIIYLSCNANPLSPEYYDNNSFYYYENSKIKLYPSNSVMLLKFKDNVSIMTAKKILNDYQLELYSKLYLHGGTVDSLIKYNEGLFLKIKKGRKSISSYITKYPKSHISYSRVGNLPEVKYCLRSYSPDKSNNDFGRIFITDEIVFKMKNADNSINDILKKYSLKLIPKEYLGDNVYYCELTDNSPKDPLRIANEIHEFPNVEWSTPDFITFTMPE